MPEALRPRRSGDVQRPHTLRRPVCELLGCDLPLVLAGMGGVARAELVIAVTNAGGFGLLGMVREPPALIRAQVAQVRAATSRPFGVSIIPAATAPGLLDQQIDTLLALHVPAVCLFWDLAADLVRTLREHGILVLCQVGSADEAREAQAAGAQIVVAQGVEAGGHVRGTLPLAQLLPGVLAAVQVPVLAAGGLVDGSDVAAAMAAGAQGAMLGTALIATHESFAHPYHRQRIVDARADDTLLTDAFHVNWPAGAKVRVLANSVTRGERGDPFHSPPTVIGDEEGRPLYLFSTDSPLRTTTGDLEAMALYAGEGASRVRTLQGAGERLARIAAAAAAALGAQEPRMPQTIHRTALAAALDELLSAERAGARVALSLELEVRDAALLNLVRQIHRDEVRWCGVLMVAIRHLGATPGTRTGDFFDKVMALPSLDERLRLLNRGQGWVVKKLTALLPGIDDGSIAGPLREMLAAHAANIGQLDDQLSGRCA